MQSLVEYFVYLLLALLIHLIPHSLAISTPGMANEETILKKEYPVTPRILLCDRQKPTVQSPCGKQEKDAAYFQRILGAS